MAGPPWVGRGAGMGAPLPVPPSTPPDHPSPIRLLWGFPGWPHDTLHDITCLLIIALRSATRQQRLMGLVTDTLTEWLCRVVLCRVPLPPSPSPSLVSLLPRKHREHTLGTLSLPLSNTGVQFSRFAVMKSLLTSGPAAECYSGASSAVPLWPSCSFSIG